MARCWKRADQFDLGIGRRRSHIRCEFGLAPGDEVQRIVDIVGLRELWFNARKDAERYESLFA
jgi:hypothetical protein